MELAVPLIIVAIVLIAVALLLRRQRPERKAVDQGAGAPGRRGAVAEEEVDFTHPRPKVAELHVVDDEARVTFDVPPPEEHDEVLAELLVNEAVEVVREKRHTLPMEQVTSVVALAGRGPGAKELGRANLETPGELPPRAEVPSMLNLSHIAADPLEADIEEGDGQVPDTVAPVREDTLPPVAQEVRIPKAVETGLRAQGIDPKQMSAVQLVTGMLALVGYQVSPGMAEGTYIAEKGGRRTFIREDRYQPGDYPEVDSETIRRFIVEFTTSGADRGLLVSEKYGPFEIYEKERREPRVRFITRERLQKMVDSLALG